MTPACLDIIRNARVTQTGSYVRFDVNASLDAFNSNDKFDISLGMSLPVMFVFSNKKGKAVDWWFNGIPYNPHGPALICDFSDRYEEIHTGPDGRVSRRDGPARINHQYGIHYVEEWIQSGTEFHRDDGLPAVTTIIYGHPHSKTWKDFSSRSDIKHYLKDDDLAQNINTKTLEWFIMGVRRREDGPANIVDKGVAEHTTVNRDGKVIRTRCINERIMEWHQGDDGKIHRLDGPGRVTLWGVKEVFRDGDQSPLIFTDWTSHWFVHGEEVPALKIYKWAKKNGITVKKEPCFNQTAFISPKAEVAFMTDIAMRIKS